LRRVKIEKSKTEASTKPDIRTTNGNKGKENTAGDRKRQKKRGGVEKGQVKKIRKNV